MAVDSRQQQDAPYDAGRTTTATGGAILFPTRAQGRVRIRLGDRVPRRRFVPLVAFVSPPDGGVPIPPVRGRVGSSAGHLVRFGADPPALTGCVRRRRGAEPPVPRRRGRHRADCRRRSSPRCSRRTSSRRVLCIPCGPGFRAVGQRRTAPPRGRGVRRVLRGRPVARGHRGGRRSPTPSSSWGCSRCRDCSGSTARIGGSPLRSCVRCTRSGLTRTARYVRSE
jgi:hypothetical protein